MTVSFSLYNGSCVWVSGSNVLNSWLYYSFKTFTLFFKMALNPAPDHGCTWWAVWACACVAPFRSGAVEPEELISGIKLRTKSPFRAFPVCISTSSEEPWRLGKLDPWRIKAQWFLHIRKENHGVILLFFVFTAAGLWCLSWMLWVNEWKGDMQRRERRLNPLPPR